MTPKEKENLLRKAKIDSTTLFKSSFLRLDFDKIYVRPGKIIEYSVIRHPGAAVIIPITENGDLILIEQYRYPIKQTILEFPAGKIDPGEDPETCAIRELQEEIGMRPKTVIPFMHIFPAPGYADEKLYFFLAKDLSLDPLPKDEFEAITLVTLPVKEALRLAMNGEIQDGKTLAGILLYHAKLTEISS